MATYNPHQLLRLGLWPLLLAISGAIQGIDFEFKSGSYYKTPRAIQLQPDRSYVDKLPYDEFTVCFYVKIDSKKDVEITLVSYATDNDANEMNVVVKYGGSNSYTSLTIGGNSALFKAVPIRGGWTHMCLSWNSEFAEASLYLDGEDSSSEDDTSTLEEGYKIKGGCSLVYGQDQDSCDGGYDGRQGLTGAMTQINWWDTALGLEEVQAARDCNLTGNFVDWDESRHAFSGNLELRPTTAPCYEACGEINSTPCKNRAPTLTSKYDLTTGFDDKEPHDVTAILKETFSYLDEFTYCFHLYDRVLSFRMKVIQFYDESYKKEVMAFGFSDSPNYGFYVKIGKAPTAWFDDALLPDSVAPICVSWSSQVGTVTLYYKGENVASVPNIAKGYTLPYKMSVRILQRQFAPLNPANPTDGFRFKGSDFYLWIRKLLDVEVEKFSNCTGSITDHVVCPSNSEWTVVDKGCPAHDVVSPIEGRDNDNYPPKGRAFVGMYYFYQNTPPPEIKDMTITFWCYSRNENPTLETFFAARRYANVAVNNGALVFTINGQNATSASYFEAQTWYFCAITWSSSDGSVKFYVDGENVGEASGIATGYTIPEGTTWVLKNIQDYATYSDDPTYSFIWKCLEFNVFNQCLSEDDIQVMQKCKLSIQGTVINAQAAPWKLVA